MRSILAPQDSSGTELQLALLGKIFKTLVFAAFFGLRMEAVCEGLANFVVSWYNVFTLKGRMSSEII